MDKKVLPPVCHPEKEGAKPVEEKKEVKVKKGFLGKPIKK
jgi:hypothetical protein